MMRGCGVLLHLSSLPGKGGVGSMGDEARAFVDFLAEAGQTWWQVLPLTPPARGNSPYSSFSVFAGNPAFINLDDLEREGLLSVWTRSFQPGHFGEKACYQFMRKVHLPLLRQSLQPGVEKYRSQLADFRQKNSFWLEDYALFMALRKKQENAPFTQWPEALRRRDPAAISIARADLADEIDFWVWVQFLFFKQWGELRDYAHKQGIGIIGDMPIYADADSSDVWACPEVFQVDADGLPTKVAGVPPDFFSSTGQRWGNPLYDWAHLKSNGYDWWIQRMQHADRLYDMVRIDHFRGLDEYYAIPAESDDARQGEWMPGPGLEFIHMIQKRVPHCRLIAEDLGVDTPSLRELLKKSGLPGMKVLQFAFDPTGDSSFLPHHFKRNCVGYTGTHDNDTVMGWMQSAEPGELRYAKEYLGLNRREGYYWGFIRGLYATVADIAIVPMQDFLGLGSEGRMNIPSVAEGNWIWRVDGRCLTKRLATRMCELADRYRRIPSKRERDAVFQQTDGE